MNSLFLTSLALLTWSGIGQSQGSSEIKANNWDEFGTPHYRNYSAKEYNGHFQNWDIIQDQNGVILAANNDGLLEYEGVKWRRHGMDGLRSLARDKMGTIYCGTGNHFGYFTHDSIGNIKFKSLSNNVVYARSGQLGLFRDAQLHF